MPFLQLPQDVGENLPLRFPLVSAHTVIEPPLGFGVQSISVVLLVGAPLPAPADPERERIPWVLASDPGAIYADAGQGLSVTRASTSLRG